MEAFCFWCSRTEHGIIAAIKGVVFGAFEAASRK
jgi:hypothetical protein